MIGKRQAVRSSSCHARKRGHSLGFLALGALLASGCATLPYEPPPASSYGILPPSPVPGALMHPVQPGETLWSIGKRYGTPYQKIMQANGLTDPRDVPVGRILVIPRPLASAVRVPLYPNAQWTHIVVHHSATASGNARILDRSHRKRGFSNGLGYHFVIDNGTEGHGDGQIEIGRRWVRQQEGAHCNAGGMNQHGIGICLVGNFTHRQPSAAQMSSLAALVDQLRAYYRIPLQRVIRHRDVPGKGTACPGDRFPWPAFKQQLADTAR